MPIHVSTTANPLTAAREAALKDATLSFTAKGLYSYLFTHTADAVADINAVHRCHIADRHNINVALQELVDKGYLISTRSDHYQLADAAVTVDKGENHGR